MSGRTNADAPFFHRLQVNEAGQAYEPFNLRRERTEGYFDESGNYVWNKVTAEERDPWLEELDAMAPKQRVELQSAAAKAAGVSLRAAGGAGDDEQSDDASGDGEGANEEDDASSAALAPARRVEHLRTLLDGLEEGESVAAALRRLGKREPSSSGGAGRGKAQPRDLAAFNRVTEAADALLAAGLVDVYTMKQRELNFELRDAEAEAGALTGTRGTMAAGSTSSTTAMMGMVPPAGGGQWEYKWSLEPDAQSFGPFSAAHMAAWVQAGFFSSAQPVYVRRIGGAQASLPSAAAPPAAASAASGAALDMFADDDTVPAASTPAPATAAAPLPSMPNTSGGNNAEAEWKRFDEVQFV